MTESDAQNGKFSSYLWLWLKLVIQQSNNRWWTLKCSIFDIGFCHDISGNYICYSTTRQMTCCQTTGIKTSVKIWWQFMWITCGWRKQLRLCHTHTRAHAHTNVMVSTNGYKKEQKFSKSWDSQLCWRKVCKLKYRPLIWSLLHKNLCASKQRCQKSISLQKMTHTENYKDLLQRQKQFYHII